VTDDNISRNAREELSRAADFLQAADLLFANNLINDAVSRLYYFVLFTIRALLLSKGLQPKSHEAALRLFAQHFVKEKIFDHQTAHIFSKLMKYREEADYNPSYVFSREDFLVFKKEAAALAERIRDYLNTHVFSSGS